MKHIILLFSEYCEAIGGAQAFLFELVEPCVVFDGLVVNEGIGFMKIVDDEDGNTQYNIQLSTSAEVTGFSGLDVINYDLIIQSRENTKFFVINFPNTKFSLLKVFK